MTKLIYSKYSNQRNAKYAIRTDILETETERVVRKYPDSKDASAHIKNIYTIYQKLSEIFSGSCMRANRAELNEEYIQFEYLEGTSLVDIMNEYAQEDMSQFMEQIKLFADTIRTVYVQKPFVADERFQEVFGEVVLPEGMASAQYVDIDLTFSNIVVKKDIWTVIDYEWTFDFLVPIDFVLWRAAKEYLLICKPTDIGIDELCIWMGVNRKNIETFKKMEHHFQYDFCYKDQKNLYELYNRMGEAVNTSDMGAMIRECAELREKTDAQESQIVQLKTQLSDTRILAAGIQNSRCWRMTAPIRKATAAARKSPAIRSAWRGLKKIKNAGRTQQNGKEIAVHLHLYYEDLLAEFCGYLNHITEPFDLYVSCKQDANIKAIRKKIKMNVDYVRTVVVRKTPNRGRDIAPFYVLFREELLQHDYLLHIHTKKSLYNGADNVTWRQWSLKGVLKNAPCVYETLRLMDEENAGLVYGEKTDDLDVFVYHWLRNIPKSAEILGRMGMSFDSEMLQYPVGSFFWAKTEALKPLFDLNLTYEDFDEEHGQIDGTLAHALERVISRMMICQGYNQYILDPDVEVFSKNISYRGFHKYFDMTVQNTAYLDGYDTVTFDIFDTLITRLVYQPDDVFELMRRLIAVRYDKQVDYLAIRKRAEQKANEKKGKFCNIDAIYDCMMEDSTFSAKEIHELKQLEIDLEYALCIPRKDAKAIFDRLKEQGKRIILVSDMYLTAPIIRRMLKKCGYDGYDDLWISCEKGLRKDDESMWEYYQNELEGQTTVHIGDNPHSDHQLVIDRGMHAVLWLSPRSEFRFSDQYETYKEYVGTTIENSLMLGSFVNAHLYNSPFALGARGHARLSDCEEVASSFFAPMFMVFADFISREKAGKLLFLAREGQFLQRLYKEYVQAFHVPEIENSYFYTSRRAAGVAQIQGMSDIEQLIQNNYSGTIGGLFRERLGLEEICEDPMQIIHMPQDLQKVMTVIRDHEDVCMKHIQEEKARYEEYYAQETAGYDSKNICVVDVGYAGSIQYFLMRMSKQPIRGCYLATGYEVKPPKLGGTCDSVYTFNEYPMLNEIQLFLEAVTSATHGQVICMAKQNDSYVPVMKKSIPKSLQESLKMQDAIVEYITNFAELTRGLQVEFDNSLAEKMFEEIAKPGVLSQKLADTFTVNDDYTTGNGERIYDAEKGMWVGDSKL